ncbi:MAG: hypothetical protein J6L73_02730 [Muribaculaceae bacterium]|nr:hypothetical protein [Muribaculaceae bacterium]
MKSFNSKTAGLSLLSAILLTACVDDKYDLSDIDTTVGLKVNDLVIPMNMDAITLKSVIDIKDGDDIQVINGEYAVIKDGDFTSSPVNISAIDMNAPAISNTSHNCALLPGTNTYDISSNASPFSYFTDQVTDCIVSIESVGTEWTLDINMSLHESDGGKAVSVNGSISDLKLRIPRGLTLKSDASSYNPKTGIYNAGNRRVTDGKLAIHLQAIGIDAATAGIKYDYATHTASLSDECAVTGGLLTLDNASSLPQLLRMNASYNMSDIHVASFTGEIQYDITGCDFEDIDLSTLPDFLSQSGTDIRLFNPQIYISVDDPLNEYSLAARTGMTISAYDTAGLRDDYSLDSPGYFDIVTRPSQSTYRFCLSPLRPDNYFVDGPTEWVAYNSLSNVLSGDGLPSRLHVTLDNPVLPRQRVSKLPLGTQLGSVTGKYTFYAPLQLKNGSRIVYTDVMDGWSSEDLDAVTISTLTVTATVNSDLPVDAVLTAFPIDKDGRRIGDVEITGAEVKAGAKDQPITLVLTGQVRMLDGLRYNVTVTDADSKVLTPKMSLSLSNIHAKVSGEYVKKL